MDYYAKINRESFRFVKEVGAMPFALFNYYLTYVNAKNGIKPSLKTTAIDLGLLDKSGKPQVSAVSNHKKILIEKGWIKEENGVIIITFQVPKISENLNFLNGEISENLKSDEESISENLKRNFRKSEIAGQKISENLKSPYIRIENKVILNKEENKGEYTLANIESENSNVDKSHDHAPKNFEKKIDAKLSQPQEPFGKKKKFIPRTEILAGEIVTEQTEEQISINPSYPILKIYEEFFPDARLTREQLRELRTLSLDETRFRDTLKFWSLNGYKQTNLADILDCYENGGFNKKHGTAKPNKLDFTETIDGYNEFYKQFDGFDPCEAFKIH